MKLKQEFTRILWAMLPLDQQQVLVYDFLDWLYADLSPAQRQEKANLLAPRLIKRLEMGEIGLPLVLFQHFKSLSLSASVIRWVRTPGKKFTKKGAI